MSTQRRFAVAVVLLAFLSVGCLSFELPQERLATPRPTSTPTVTPIPSPTEPTATPTATSTVTPTFTITPTPTNTLPPGLALATPGAPGGLATPTQVTPSFPGGPPGGGLLPPLPGGGTSGGTNGSVSDPKGPGGVSGGGIPADDLPTATPTPVSWNCNGDERMDFIPPEPTVGDDLYITVTSSGPHGYVQLQGPLPIEKGSEGSGGPGRYWQWKKKIDKAGVYRFEFYSGPRKEHLCVTGEVRAGSGILPTPTATPLIFPTPTPSNTPRPDH